MLKKLQFTRTYLLASIKEALAIGEAFSPQKRTSSTSKHEISLLFSIFAVTNKLLRSYQKIRKKLIADSDPWVKKHLICNTE